jgi:hypothetical protein
VWFAVYPCTVIPTNPVRVVTKVVTPDLGWRMSYDVTVDQPDYKIKIDACYYDGNATEVDTHIDTVVVGPLYNGNYQLQFTAYLSYTNTYCVKVDSGKVDTTFHKGPTGINELSKEILKAEAFPNPFISDIKVLLSDNSDGSAPLTVFDSFGKKVFSDLFNDKAANILTVNWPPGVYCLVLQRDQLSRSFKLLKE